MLPLWVWFSRIKVAKYMEKNACEHYCSDHNAKMITVGHLEHATEFKILREKFLGPYRRVRDESRVMPVYKPFFEAHVDASYDWKTKVNFYERTLT